MSATGTHWWVALLFAAWQLGKALQTESGRRLLDALADRIRGLPPPSGGAA